MKKFYMAGWNVSGFLPVAEPGEFEDFEDAKEYLLTHLENMEEISDLDDRPGAASEYWQAKNMVAEWEDTNEAKAVKLSREVYWIQIARLNQHSVL